MDPSADRSRTGTKFVNPPPKEKVQMLVLETDEPHPETLDRRGSYGAIFSELFTKAGSLHEPPLEIDTTMTYVVEDDGGAVPAVSDIGDDVHAILITGSMYDAHGSETWILTLLDLIRALWVQRPDLRFSGVCFGHQILCRALGSSVEPTPGGRWELAHTKVDLTPLGQTLFRTGDKKEIHLQEMHQDQVMDVPNCKHKDSPLSESDSKKVRIWGKTDHTPIQGVYITERLFTSQGHLGFDAKMVRRQVEARVESGGIKDEDHAEEAKMTSNMEYDGELVAAAILRFFHGDDKEV